MDFFSEPEISQGPNRFSHPQQNHPHKMMEISPFHDFFDEMNTTAHLQYESKKLCSYLNEFDDLENFNFDFNLPPLDEHLEVDKKPLINMLIPEPSLKTESNGFVASVKKEFEGENEEEEMKLAMTLPLPLPLPLPRCKKKRSPNALQFDEIKKHFDVPISVAAKKMNVGLSNLKARCRELKIMRWPHRKLKSLELLINHLKERGLAEEVVMLEKQKEMLEKLPSMELNEETKKLRQAFFKANYMRRRRSFMTPSP